LILVSCTTEESNDITVKGRVEREINGEGVPNQLVILMMKQTPTGSIASSTYLN